jgi:hypothetical protein
MFCDVRLGKLTERKIVIRFENMELESSRFSVPSGSILEIEKWWVTSLLSIETEETLCR